MADHTAALQLLPLIVVGLVAGGVGYMLGWIDRGRRERNDG
jgi:hypothetical protein